MDGEREREQIFVVPIAIDYRMERDLRFGRL
jgi:hypothetical protein